LSSRDVEELLDDYLPWADAVEVNERATDLVCADASGRLCTDRIAEAVRV